MPPIPVSNSAMVPGSGTFAVAVKSRPPGQQVSLTHPKTIEKFCPLGMPAKLLLTPETKIVVTPLTVETVQFANAVVVHPITLAETPLSVSFKLLKSTPEAFVKKRVPCPLLGTPKVKVVPTDTQPGVGQAGSRMMMVGSRLESAYAAVAKTARATKMNKMRENLIEGFTRWLRQVRFWSGGRQDLRV